MTQAEMIERLVELALGGGGRPYVAADGAPFP